MIKDIYDKFIKITADDGHALTYFKEGDDILNYSSFRVVFSPLDRNNDDIREITIEEDKAYYDEQIKAINENRLNG